MEHWKKVFAIIWTGQFLSILSSIIVNFAVILWISLSTGSAEMLAWAAIAAILPQALLGPVTGVYIDRWNRKRIMILADSFIALCTLVMAWLFWLDIAEMWHIFVLLAFRSVGSAFHMPAMQASIPLLAPQEQLTRIAGISQIIQSVGNIAGPALAALFITIWDMEQVLMLDVAGAAIACITLLFVYIPDPERGEESNQPKQLLREMKEGFQAVLENRGLSWLFLFSILVMFFLMPISVLFPLMTLDHFGGDAFRVSLIEAIWGVGALLGGAIMGARVYRVNRVVLINVMNILIGMTFWLSGLLPTEGFLFFTLLTGVAGICGAVFNSAFTGLVQTYIRADALGRVFSLFYSLNLLPSLIGLIGIGFFADRLGVSLSFVVCGAVISAIGVLSFIPRSAMRLDRRE